MTDFRRLIRVQIIETGHAVAHQRKLIEFLDKVETERASRVEALSFEEMQQVFYLLADYTIQAIEEDEVEAEAV